MANYYTLFSVGIKAETDFERNWMEEAANRIFDYEENPQAEEEGWSMPDVHIDPDGAWIVSEEGASLEPVVQFAQEFLKNFHPDQCVMIEWANTCSKMRTDGFGGGAVFVTADNEKWMNTSMWLGDQEKKWRKKMEGKKKPAKKKGKKP